MRRARMIGSILVAPLVFGPGGTATWVVGCFAEADRGGDAAPYVPVRAGLRTDHAFS